MFDGHGPHDTTRKTHTHTHTHTHCTAGTGRGNGCTRHSSPPTPQCYLVEPVEHLCGIGGEIPELVEHAGHVGECPASCADNKERAAREAEKSCFARGEAEGSVAGKQENELKFK